MVLREKNEFFTNLLIDRYMKTKEHTSIEDWKSDYKNSLPWKIDPHIRLHFALSDTDV